MQFEKKSASGTSPRCPWNTWTLLGILLVVLGACQGGGSKGHRSKNPDSTQNGATPSTGSTESTEPAASDGSDSQGGSQSDDANPATNPNSGSNAQGPVDPATPSVPPPTPTPEPTPEPQTDPLIGSWMAVPYRDFRIGGWAEINEVLQITAEHKANFARASTDEATGARLDEEQYEATIEVDSTVVPSRILQQVVTLVHGGPTGIDVDSKLYCIYRILPGDQLQTRCSQFSYPSDFFTNSVIYNRVEE